MKKLIEDLIKTDEIADVFYNRAAIASRKNTELSDLFTSLSDSRRMSKNTLANAANQVPLSSEPFFDAAATAQLEKGYSTTLNLNIPNATKDLLEAALEMEFYDSGKLYSKAIDTLKEQSRSFIAAAAAAQWRRRRIETFITHMPEYDHQLELLRKLPKIWTENLLIVDDCNATATLLTDTLCKEGSIDTADNGRAAMDKIKKKYFAAIISDVSMPVMGGVDLFKSAEENYPGIGRRFIFFTDTASIRDVGFFKNNKVNYLPKPASIINIRRAVSKIIGQS
jgi:CheY-like chemotaxis protein